MSQITYVYLAGPISGLSFEEASTWRRYIDCELKTGNQKRDLKIMCLSPLRQGTYGDIHCNDGKPIGPETAVRGEVVRDLFDIQRASIVIANFSNAPRISIGTICELAWAWLLRKPIILIPDPSGMHDHGFLDEFTSFKVKDIEEAVSTARHLLRP